MAKSITMSLRDVYYEMRAAGIRCNMSVENVRKVAEYFGTTVDQLINCDLTGQSPQEVAG